MIRSICCCLLAIFCAGAAWCFADNSVSSIGPAKGSLVIAGGGALGAPVMNRFIELAGGAKASLVIIPSASENPQVNSRDPVFAAFKKLGAKVTVLHTTDRTEADKEDFAQPLKEATAVWLGGGRQWRLADVYLGTRVMPELFAVLDRGGVIGGSSAGATIQGSYLVRGAVEGNTVMMAPGHEQGFGFLKDSAIDQHWAKRQRERDMVPVIERHPNLLGIGLDEATAIVVHGNEFEVIGASVVGIYDARSTAWKSAQPWLVLRAGQRFDLKGRVVLEKASP
ncbi:MAG: cyanophycinase [Prosthecobacter sp.]|nr:cyanophycinase [Prosthecobacter sp.]